MNELLDHSLEVKRLELRFLCGEIPVNSGKSAVYERPKTAGLAPTTMLYSKSVKIILKYIS